MAKVPNLRIEISEDARRALAFEVALTGESLSKCASMAILNGVSDRAVELVGMRNLSKDVIVKPDNQINTIKSSAKVPITKDSLAIKYVMEHMDICSGVQIAKALDRSVSSVNKYIKSIKDGLVSS